MRIEGGIPSMPIDLEESSAERASNTSYSEMAMSLRVEEGVGVALTGAWLDRGRVKVELKKVLKREALCKSEEAEILLKVIVVEKLLPEEMLLTYLNIV